MRPRSLNLFLLISIVIIGALNWIIRRDFSQPNLEFLPEMVRSVPYDSFAPNPNFPDGKTLQQPVPGTIPRGFLPLHYEATPQDAERAGEELSNPYSMQDTEALQRGDRVYSNFCLPCHGPAGRGDGPVILRGYPAPPPLISNRAIRMKDGQIFHIITYGQRNMSPHATQIAREDRWKVILHIRTLQLPRLSAQSSQPK
ncbi:MAG: c-type cytochrome [Acidobacteria bacterium]|nr:c-type cytochrome [Acidobacteriota bacterium]